MGVISGREKDEKKKFRQRTKIGYVVHSLGRVSLGNWNPKQKGALKVSPLPQPRSKSMLFRCENGAVVVGCYLCIFYICTILDQR